MFSTIRVCTIMFSTISPLGWFIACRVRHQTVSAWNSSRLETASQGGPPKGYRTGRPRSRTGTPKTNPKDPHQANDTKDSNSSAWSTKQNAHKVCGASCGNPDVQDKPYLLHNLPIYLPRFCYRVLFLLLFVYLSLTYLYQKNQLVYWPFELCEWTCPLSPAV